jgi:hypothetical protein
MSHGRRFALAAVLLGTGALACPQYARVGPLVERVQPETPPGRFQVIAAIAGNRNISDLRISATARKQLTDSGINVVRRGGRYDTEASAVQQVCASEEAPRVDGVLFIWHDRLSLYDCTTERSAYEVSGGTDGIQGMTNRLYAYLRRDAPAVSSVK